MSENEIPPPKVDMNENVNENDHKCHCYFVENIKNFCYPCTSRDCASCFLCCPAQICGCLLCCCCCCTVDSESILPG